MFLTMNTILFEAVVTPNSGVRCVLVWTYGLNADFSQNINAYTCACAHTDLLHTHTHTHKTRVLLFCRASLIAQLVKKSTCNVEDPGSITGSGRSTGEGIGYPPQYSWASLVAQLVKNPPAMWEPWIQSLGWEDPLEKGKATHSSILACRIPWTA